MELFVWVMAFSTRLSMFGNLPIAAYMSNPKAKQTLAFYLRERESWGDATVWLI